MTNNTKLKVIMPQELEVWYILPALRRELAKEMLKLNLKKAEIARKLGLSRAAVTQYLNSKRASEIKFDKNTLSEIKLSAKSLANNESCLIHHMHNLCKICRQNKVLCKIHKCDHDANNCCEICLK